ncbi:unnamed protein product, partial [Chrysoparadoxa australica]
GHLLPCPPEAPPPTQLRNGSVKIELGKHKVDPFQRETFSQKHLHALQILQSDSDRAFGAAFISLRSNQGQYSTRSYQLGKVDASHMVALHRFKIWWMRPTHARDVSDIPPETQLMLCQMPPTDEGKVMYSLFLPLIDGECKCNLRGTSDGSLQLTAETGCSKTPVPSKDLAGLYVAVHDDPFELLDKSFKLLRKRLSGQAERGLVRDAQKQIVKWKRKESVSGGRDTSAPDFVDYLGWCTWDSFYTSIDSEKVIKGLESLKSSGVKPKWLVLDDGWQSTSNVDAPNGEQWMDHLTSLVANKKFRDEAGGIDLKDTVSRAKTEFGVEYFMVWHAIAGYWAGVEMDSPDIAKYKPKRATLKPPPAGIVEVDPEMKMFFRVSRFLNKRFGVLPPDQIFNFYDDYHRYLRQQGVDGVKVDAQAVLNFVGSGLGGSVQLAHDYHKALSRSVKRHFPYGGGSNPGDGSGLGGRIIHCMCHDNEILLQLPNCYGKRVLIRGSDDFYPRDPSSHGTHLYANAFNSLLLARCGLQDWDMFTTNIGPASWLHAASRAISGGPVYISDRPGEHNRSILQRMVLDDGSVLRPLMNAQPTLKSLFKDPQSEKDSLLGIWNENPVAGHGVVGVFNIYGSDWNQQRRAYASISVSSDRILIGIPMWQTLTAPPLPTPAGFQAKHAPSIRGSISPSDCHTLLRQREAQASDSSTSRGDVYAMYFHNEASLTLGSMDKSHPVTIKPQSFELAAVSVHLNFAPPMSPTLGNEIQWSSIGLVDLFNAGGCILSEEIRPSAAASSSAVKGSGRFLAVCSEKPAFVTLDGLPVPSKIGKTRNGIGYLEVILPTPYLGASRLLEVLWQ